MQGSPDIKNLKWEDIAGILECREIMSWKITKSG